MYKRGDTMKINVTATDKLNAAIDVVQKRASARTITARDIQLDVERIEKALKKVLPKKHWKGAKFIADINAQTFPSSYNGTPESTKFALVRAASGWFVTNIWRGATCGTRLDECELSDEQKAELANFVVKNL